MIKNQFVKMLSTEIEELSVTPKFKDGANHDMIAIEILARQKASDLLVNLLDRIENKNKKGNEEEDNKGEFVI